MDIVLLFLAWFGSALVATGIVSVDLYKNQSHLGRLMKIVWVLSTLYAGLIGLGVYWYSGRKEISQDSLWRRGWRSTAHCFSGCGLGEIIGVFVGVQILHLATSSTAALTFGLAYSLGMVLTVGPLMHDGVDLLTAVKDAVYTETASITVMEAVAISIDLWLIQGSSSGMLDPFFYLALVVSLLSGFAAAYPVNVLLIKYGVKSGMHNPKHAHHE